jgi:hypothetical protein
MLRRYQILALTNLPLSYIASLMDQMLGVFCSARVCIQNQIIPEG